MSVIKSALAASPDELRANREFYEGRVADLRARRAAAVAAGTESARAALREAGQLLVRERVSALLDPGSPAKACTAPPRRAPASWPAWAWCRAGPAC